MSTYDGFMNVYNGFGGTITKVKALHTTENGTRHQISVETLAAGASATAVAIVAFSDQRDNWTLEFTDSAGTRLSVGFVDVGFELKDAGGTVVYNISRKAVKLCFPQSGDALEKF